MLCHAARYEPIAVTRHGGGRAFDPLEPAGYEARRTFI